MTDDLDDAVDFIHTFGAPTEASDSTDQITGELR